MVLDSKKGRGGPAFCIFTALTVCLYALNLDGCDTAIKAAPEIDPGFEILQNEYWLKRYTECAALADRGDSEIIFLGDSMIYGWEFFGTADWNTINSRYTAGNFGVGSIGTRHLLWMLNTGLFCAKTKPEYAVVLIGTNDHFHNPLNPLTTVKTIRNILDAIKAQSPHTGVILVSILPRGDNSLFDHRNRCFNEIISWFQGPGISYLDVYNDFLDGAGNINKSLYRPDLLHLNSSGYALLTKKLLPLIP
jgi:lysophospholipase L1-like esterase